MKKSLKLPIIVAALVVVVAAIGFLIKPIFKSINYGLDLQGGFEILYQIEGLNGEEVTSEMVTSTYKTVLKRIDVLGVSEPEITIEGNDRIRIKLAGITNEDQAREMLSTEAVLSFRDINDDLLMTSAVLESGQASISQNQYGLPVVKLAIKDRETFYDVTSGLSTHTDGTNMIVIWLDYTEGANSYKTEYANCGSLTNSRCLSAATVSQGFASDVIIDGDFTTDEVTTLVDLINSGSLPTKLTEISSNSVSASLGNEALHKTLIAGIIGVILVLLMMSIIYRISGLISSVGIIIYSFIVLLTFWVIGGVLTLPGIAAIVLGIGMAVDASVITFERVKDELYEGRSLKTAFKNGNKRSMSTILDANITTLLVAIILFALGESSVKGFATMLIISIIVTIFVMVFVVRFIMNKLINTNKFDDKTRILFGVKKEDIPNVAKNEKRSKFNFKKVDFVSNRKLFFGISSSLLIAGAVVIAIFGLKLGVDYQGGTNITVASKEELTVQQIEESLNKLNLNAEEINLLNNDLGASIILKGELSKETSAEVKDYFENKYEIAPNISVISHIVKKELTKNAIYAVIIAILGIIIYMTLRFKLSYAIAAIVALLHDIFIVIGFFALFRIEINVTFIAAILAILGYSINDTIVAFDKIREHYKANPNESKRNIVNISLRETLLRSLYTSITTLLPVIALIIFGSFEIINFNVAMFVGLIAGTYSSIFIASQLWIYLENWLKSEHKKEETELEETNIKGINA